MLLIHFIKVSSLKEFLHWKPAFVKEDVIHMQQLQSSLESYLDQIN